MAVNKLFLDTNIVLDFVLSREGELNEIERIFNLAKEGSFECFISESVITNCIYVLEKDKKDSLQILRTLCSVLKVLPYLPSVLYSSIEVFNDKEDGFLYFLAQHHKMDFFITRNIKDFKNAPLILPVLTPKNFIKYFNSDDIS
jgi:predicted nucleic acid-binding protein